MAHDEDLAGPLPVLQLHDQHVVIGLRSGRRSRRAAAPRPSRRAASRRCRRRPVPQAVPAPRPEGCPAPAAVRTSACSRSARAAPQGRFTSVCWLRSSGSRRRMVWSKTSTRRRRRVSLHELDHLRDRTPASTAASSSKSVEAAVEAADLETLAVDREPAGHRPAVTDLHLPRVRPRRVELDLRVRLVEVVVDGPAVVDGVVQRRAHASHRSKTFSGRSRGPYSCSVKAAWIPAFAGMTARASACHSRGLQPSRKRGDPSVSWTLACSDLVDRTPMPRTAGIRPPRTA